jgi:hypothetical protein
MEHVFQISLIADDDDEHWSNICDAWMNYGNGLGECCAVFIVLYIVWHRLHLCTQIQISDDVRDDCDNGGGDVCLFVRTRAAALVTKQHVVRMSAEHFVVDCWATPIGVHAGFACRMQNVDHNFKWKYFLNNPSTAQIVLQPLDGFIGLVHFQSGTYSALCFPWDSPPSGWYNAVTKHNQHECFKCFESVTHRQAVLPAFGIPNKFLRAHQQLVFLLLLFFWFLQFFLYTHHTPMWGILWFWNEYNVWNVNLALQYHRFVWTRHRCANVALGNELIGGFDGFIAQI